MTAPLLDGSQTPGVYRVLGDLDAIADALRGAGWVAAPVPSLGSTAEFYAATARALGFPNHFGANLDALWDSLTDLTAPTALVLADWTRLARADPSGWSRIYVVLRERARTAPAFALLLS